uniref:Uncharacterized protein n=1 Tax=Oryza brachyantha TaxID=4533 RepID=J3LQ88_ORYBR
MAMSVRPSWSRPGRTASTCLPSRASRSPGYGRGPYRSGPHTCRHLEALLAADAWVDCPTVLVSDVIEPLGLQHAKDLEKVVYIVFSTRKHQAGAQALLSILLVISAKVKYHQSTSLFNLTVTLNIDGGKYTIEMVRRGPRSYTFRMNNPKIEAEIHSLRLGGLLMQLALSFLNLLRIGDCTE